MKNPLITPVIIFTGLILLTSCGNDKQAQIESLDWMLGKWESSTTEGTLFEEWTQIDDSTYIGHAFALSSEGDTTFSENAKIMSRAGVITYRVTVNHAVTTDFTLVDIQGQAVFENEKHDYPQRIIYRNNSSDSLYARIEGRVDGTESSEEFSYAKSKK